MTQRMDGGDIAQWSGLIMFFATAGFGVIKWAAMRQEKADAERREQARKATEAEKVDEARRIAETPEMQRVMAEAADAMIKTYAEQNRQLLAENVIQRQRHQEDRRSWEEERRVERMEWQRQVKQWERDKARFEEVIDDLRRELAPYRRPKGEVTSETRSQTRSETRSETRRSDEGAE